MSLTRGMLKGMGLTEEQVSAIIDAHAETVEGLKESLKAAKADAGKLEAAQKELDALKAQGGDDYKSKYEKEHADFEEYKQSVAGEKAAAEKRDLYRQLLTEVGIDPKRIDAVMRVADLDKVSVANGAIEDAEGLKKAVAEEWSDFIPQTSTRGASVPTPPPGGKTTMSKEQILAIKDTAERQKAIAENHEVFGF